MDFIDLKTQQKRVRSQIEARFQAILNHGAYIMGPEIAELEKELASYTGARHCLSCSSGTDALLMPLMALGVGPGDGVLVPAFTFFATAEVVSLAGATPIFVDVNPDTFNIDAETVLQAIEDAKTRFPKIKIKGIMPVDLFGLCAEYESILQIAEARGLFVIEDAAQSFGATYRGKKSCALAPIAGTSFFPAKPLGCYGDGGAIFCSDDVLLEKLKSIRIHGQGVDKYQNVRIGLNGRLDSLQAAVLLEKLKIFDDELEKRQQVANRYTEGLQGIVETPGIPEGFSSAWAQYTIKTAKRDQIVEALKRESIPSMIYYTIPLHLQEAFRSLGYVTGDMPVAEKLSHCVVSLPMHPYLKEEDQGKIIAAVKKGL